MLYRLINNFGLIDYNFELKTQNTLPTKEVVMALGSAEKKEIVTKFGRKEGDTGSPEVQIALLSKRIADLTEHLKGNAKDHSSRLGLLKLVGQRKRLMQYLKRSDFVTYTKVIKELSIRDK